MIIIEITEILDKALGISKDIKFTVLFFRENDLEKCKCGIKSHEYKVNKMINWYKELIK